LMSIHRVGTINHARGAANQTRENTMDALV
jgi:hypothetical protein